MSIAIAVQHVSKQYRLGTINHGTIQEDLARAWARVRGKPDPSAKIAHEEHRRQEGQSFWALDDVSFEVAQGDVLGVIGRNGAGKSTLFKVLTQVTAPTSGRIELTGRVASLLEVGTGFHPELTGRENVFLNGAILGMTKEEIRRKFDEIVAFSGCETFIDTPVKRYSSGMYVRLAFAVAAHLESEILIVDEVLAVGDAQFQKKCLDKMQDVSGQGRTVLFVSHSMAAVAALCRSAVLLRDGRIVQCGVAADVMRLYQEEASQGQDGLRTLAERPRTGTGRLRFSDVTVTALDRGGRTLPAPIVGCDLRFALSAACYSDVEGIAVGVYICDSNGYRVIDLTSAHRGEFLSFERGQLPMITFHARDVLLKPGTYQFHVVAGRPNLEVMDYVEAAGHFEMHEDVGSVEHWEVFPAVYRCRYSREVHLTSPTDTEREAHVDSR